MKLYIDRDRREIISANGTAALTPLEYRVLCRLVEKLGELVPKDDLIFAAYPDDKIYSGVADDSLATIIQQLRCKLDLMSARSSSLLMTVRGEGYILYGLTVLPRPRIPTWQEVQFNASDYPWGILTEREREIFCYFGELQTVNLTEEALASELKISVNTLKTHMRNMYRKLNINSRAEMAVMATTAKFTAMRAEVPDEV
ncbi:winged helix-turn-helix domain-containing protein [Chloroflexi bacterium TSY]|nr:winged helix-turn-helix domain-containing protein [Chloroflexi bacterium TSY]